MKKISLIITSFFLLSFSGITNINDNHIYHAVYIPDEYLVNIEIDGKIDDWSWVPDKYVVKANQLIFQDNSIFDENDLDGYFMVGWNKITNWIYLVAKIYDDNLEISGDGYRDKFSFQSNTSNSTQNNWTNLMTIEFSKKLSGESIARNIRNPRANWMLKDEFGKWAVQIEEDSIRNKNILTYEIGIQLWDKWSSSGEEYSVKHDLDNNQIIGLIVSILDYDENESRKLLYTISGSQGKYWGYPFFMSDFILDPLVNSDNILDELIRIVDRHSMPFPE